MTSQVKGTFFYECHGFSKFIMCYALIVSFYDRNTSAIVESTHFKSSFIDWIIGYNFLGTCLWGSMHKDDWAKS